MNARFRIPHEITPDHASWGTSRMVSHPRSTGARQITALDATVVPGEAQSFHKHPNQEEVIYVAAGTVEQWIDEEKRVLRPGDSAFIPPGTVHATFNVGEDAAKLFVVFSPCVGEGFETVDVAGEAPWNRLRI